MSHSEGVVDLFYTRDGPEPGQPPVHERIHATDLGWVRDNAVVHGDRKRAYPYTASGSKLIRQENIVHDWWWTNHPTWEHYIATEPAYHRYWLKRFAHTGFPGMDEKLTELKTKALNKLVFNAQQLGANIGESPETIRMLAQTAKTLTQAIIAAKRGNWSALPRILGLSRDNILSGKFPANKWLEYQYGWKPLMQDIVAAQQKAHEHLAKGKIIRVTAGFDTSSGDQFPDGDGTVDISRSSGLRLTIVAKVESPGIAEANSWGLINPLSIAWELVPFSFVVDWFMPIGNTLSALTAPVGLTFLDGWFSERHRSNVSWRGWNRRQGNDYVVDRSGGYLEVENWAFSRHLLAGFPMPGLYFTSPFVNKDDSLKSTRILNGLALLR